MPCARSIPGGSGYGGWDAGGIAPFATWRDYLHAVAMDASTDRDHGWRAQLEASAPGADRFDVACDVLKRLTDDLPEVRHVVHSDLLNANVLARDHAIEGVLDWSCGLTGDFVYDLAQFAWCWSWFPQWNESTSWLR